MKVLVLMNEQHSILPNQESILNGVFGEDGWQILKVPAQGWDKEQMDRLAHSWADLSGDCHVRTVVFLSPIPYLLMKVMMMRCHWGENKGQLFYPPRAYLFHNDRREKVEVAPGKFVTMVAKDGWELVTT